MGEATLLVELTNSSLLVFLAQLGLIVAMRGTQLPLLFLETLGHRRIHVAQFTAPVRKRTQLSKRAGLKLLEVAAQASLVLLVVECGLEGLLVRLAGVYRGLRVRLGEDGCEERLGIAVLDFTSLSVENWHCQDRGHHGHVLLLLKVWLWGLLRLTMGGGYMVRVLCCFFKDGLLFKLPLRHQN